MRPAAALRCFSSGPAAAARRGGRLRAHAACAARLWRGGRACGVLARDAAFDLRRGGARSRPRSGGRGACAPRLGAGPGGGCGVRGAFRGRGGDRADHRGAPVGADSRIRRRPAGLLGRPHEQRGLQAAHFNGRRGRHHPKSAQGAGGRAAGRRVRPRRNGRGGVRLCPFARDAHVPVAVPVDGARDDHGLAVRVRAAGGRTALAAGAREVNIRGFLRSSATSRSQSSPPRSPGCRPGHSDCLFRSCLP